MSRRLPKEKRDKLILVGLGTAAAVLAIYFAVINIQRETLKGVQKRRVEAEQKVAQGKTTLKLEQTVEGSFTQAAAKLKTAEANLAAPNDMYSWLIQTMKDFRLGHNVDIPQFSRETPSDVAVFAKFPYHAAVFTVSGTAHFHDFGRFLADFENKHPYIRVQNLELEPLTDTTGSGTTREKLTFKMNLLTLVRPVAQ